MVLSESAPNPVGSGMGSGGRADSAERRKSMARETATHNMDILITFQ